MSNSHDSRKSLVCFGDSITEGEGSLPQDKWTLFLQELVDKAHPGTYKVHNCGVGGDTTAIGIDRIEQDVLPLLPGLVLVQFGINDAYVFPWSRLSRLSLAEYERNLGEMVRILRKRGGSVILIRNHTNCCNHPQGNGRTFLRNFAPFDRALCNMAARRRIRMIDLPDLMEQAGLTAGDMVSDDGLHLSPEGNRHYAELVFIGLKRLKRIFSS